MLDTRPAALDEASGPDPWAEFRVSDPTELLRLLKALRDSSVPVHLNAPQGFAVTTQLWSLEPEQGQMGFSADDDGPQMQRLAQCDEAIAVAYLDSVKLQFELGGLLLVRSAHSCALRARIPALVHRFQRRSGYRVRMAERQGPKALLRHPSMPDMQLALRIVDLSVGGCALQLPDDVPMLPPGCLLRGVRVLLDGGNGFDAALRLQHVSAVHGAAHGLRMGCEFVGLDGAAQRLLQRYIDQLQQRRRVLTMR